MSFCCALCSIVCVYALYGIECFPTLQFSLQWEVALARRCSCCSLSEERVWFRPSDVILKNSSSSITYSTSWYLTRKYSRSFIHLTTSRTGVIVRFWKHLCDHERSSIHQHSGFALGSYQSLYIFFYSFIMLCFNIHSANLEISRYASKKCSWQFGNMTRARVLFLFRFCVRIQICVGLGESLIH